MMDRPRFWWSAMAVVFGFRLLYAGLIDAVVVCGCGGVLLLILHPWTRGGSDAA
jgi:hypothetical protein